MNKNKYSTIIDYGSSNFRLGIFNENLENLYISSKAVVEKNDYNEHFSSINFLIKDAEKKISNHIENIVVLYDDKDISSVDLSIKRDFDQKIFIDDIYSSIILEANQLIKNNYINKKIIHVIIVKNIIDSKEYTKKFNENLKAKSIILEIKFICLNEKKFNQVSDVFKKCNLKIINFFCSSYVKSLSYVDSFNDKLVSLLDIGFERSTLLIFNKKKLIHMNSIPIGGNHITKDISNVLKLDINDSEMIKKAFNKSENEFSYYQKINESSDFIKQITDNSISIDILKKVVLARIEEIFDLIFKDLVNLNDFNNYENSLLVLTGNGSKLFDKNSFHLSDKYSFKEINYYEEEDLEICKSGLKSEISLGKEDIKIFTKNQIKPGIFERFFNFFSR